MLCSRWGIVIIKSIGIICGIKKVFQIVKTRYYSYTRPLKFIYPKKGARRVPSYI